MDGRIRSGGFTRSDAGIVLVVLLCLGGCAGILWPGYQREWMHDNIARCGSNLSAIGKAMAAYANDYDGTLPVVGSRGTK